VKRGCTSVVLVEHLKIREKHALQKIQHKRVNQHEASFLKKSAKPALQKIPLLGEIQGKSATGRTSF
jgi:hypothetical protein